MKKLSALGHSALVRRWLEKALVGSVGDVPEWAVVLYRAGAWKWMPYRHVQRIASDADMQQAILAVHRLGDDGAVLEAAQELTWP